MQGLNKCRIRQDAKLKRKALETLQKRGWGFIFVDATELAKRRGDEHAGLE